MTDPRKALPSLMHSPVRLAILSSLATVQHSEFSVLKEAFGVSDQELSRQLALLEEGGLVEIAKTRRSRKAVTLVRLSDEGKTKFDLYLEHLRGLLPGETAHVSAPKI